MANGYSQQLQPQAPKQGGYGGPQPMQQMQPPKPAPGIWDAGAEPVTPFKPPPQGPPMPAENMGGYQQGAPILPQSNAERYMPGQPGPQRPQQGPMPQQPITPQGGGGQWGGSDAWWGGGELSGPGGTLTLPGVGGGGGGGAGSGGGGAGVGGAGGGAFGGCGAFANPLSGDPMQANKYEWAGGDPQLNQMIGSIDWSSIPGINTTQDKQAAIQQFMQTGIHPTSGSFVGDQGYWEYAPGGPPV